MLTKSNLIVGNQETASRSSTLSDMVPKYLKRWLARGAAFAVLIALAAALAIAPPVKQPLAEGAGPVSVITATTPSSFLIANTPGLASVQSLKRTVSRVLEVKPGDTLMNLALKTGVSRRQAHEAIVALTKIFNPRRLKPGQRLTVTYVPKDAEEEDARLSGLQIQANAYQGFAVKADESNGFVAKELTKELVTRLARAQGTIEGNLYDAAEAAGVPPAVLIKLIRFYSWDVDFQRDIQPGDSFVLVYERVMTIDGEHVRDGDIVYSRLTVNGADLPLYRYEFEPGRTDYFDARGESARKPLLRTPVDGARLTSSYGRRRHPILGYTRMHRGVDFAAPRGSPIYAGGDGRIVSRGRNGGYGRYIRIRHNSTYSTAYGHMRAYKRGLRVGSRVQQGQVIGYVGSSGRSTGPHLHYEIHRNGRQVHPLRIKLPSGRKLKGESLKAFETARQEIGRTVAGLAPPAAVAQN